MRDALPINNTDVPAAYVGAWRTSSAYEETIWLQTHRLHASISLAPNRPDFTARRSWDDYSDADLWALAQQGGVAGACIAQGDILHRRRQIDYLPRRGVTELRRMRRDGSYLYEATLDERQPITWELLAGPEQTLIALRFQDAGIAPNDDQRKGYLLVVGMHFLFVRDRAVATPLAESLAVLVECKHYPRSEFIALLDFEISYGVRPTDDAAPWIILRSTLPHREGRALLDMATLRRVAKAGPHQGHALRWNGQPYLRYWSLDEWQEMDSAGRDPARP